TGFSIERVPADSVSPVLRSQSTPSGAPPRCLEPFAACFGQANGSKFLIGWIANAKPMIRFLLQPALMKIP
ncbi:MAG: hypothetical protein AAGL49_15200, partial [Pseudomonadota bacterium]